MLYFWPLIRVLIKEIKMPFGITIAKKTSDKESSLEIKEMYFLNSTKEMVVLSKFNETNREEAKSTFVAQAEITFSCPDKLVKSLKSVIATDDDDLKAQSDSYKKERCVFSKMREINKDNEIQIRHVFDGDPADLDPLDDQNKNLPAISMRTLGVAHGLSSGDANDASKSVLTGTELVIIKQATASRAPEPTNGSGLTATPTEVGALTTRAKQGLTAIANRKRKAPEGTDKQPQSKKLRFASAP